ncbi:MAG TPA: ribbon-helix-helix protein, CopG family [Gemmatimonadota bacterium]|nr:ribbon-helix-helix protein, CopG family [Gemmatimonadota bacterium]
MRTTVEIPDEIRARLLELAARRGERGFSGIVEEALERYLAEEERRRERAEAARAVLGSLEEEDADALLASVRRLRDRWR